MMSSLKTIESNVFDQGSVPLGTFAFKLLSSKGSIWVTTVTKVKAADAHVITIMLWVHDIISTHWSSAPINRDTTKKENIKTKKTCIVLSGRNPQVPRSG